MIFVLLVKLLIVAQWSRVSGSTPEGRVQNFVATENSNLEVLKELGVDIQNEGRTHKKCRTLFLSLSLSLSLSLFLSPQQRSP
jgi:hypothetical protein